MTPQSFKQSWGSIIEFMNDLWSNTGIVHLDDKMSVTNTQGAQSLYFYLFAIVVFQFSSTLICCPLLYVYLPWRLLSMHLNLHKL